MKKVFVIIPILFSYLMGNAYGEGFKFYRQAKKELRLGNVAKANKLFQESKIKFEIGEKKNSSQAIAKLAELYCNGWGVNADKTKAELYLKKAKKLGLSFFADQCLKNLK